MLVEWLRNRWFLRKGYCPKDKFKYIIASEVIQFTAKILQEYGKLNPAAEGLVYWAGSIKNNTYVVNAAVAPKTDSSRYGIFTSHESNARFVEFISDCDLLYIAQVHSHPSAWVNHSVIDNEETAFRSEGLVSVVVPHYGQLGVLPFSDCGIHRYERGQFKRLSNTYLRRHFKEKKILNVTLKDLRYE